MTLAVSTRLAKLAVFSESVGALPLELDFDRLVVAAGAAFFFLRAAPPSRDSARGLSTGSNTPPLGANRDCG